MQRHTKIYYDAFGYTKGDFVACEVCGAKANDIHHIKCRGMGGDPQGKKDVIENLQAICRLCHMKYGDKKEYMSMLIQKHLEFMEFNGLKPDYGYHDRNNAPADKGLSESQF